jgi:hypothetical protein
MGRSIPLTKVALESLKPLDVMAIRVMAASAVLCAVLYGRGGLLRHLLEESPRLSRLFIFLALGFSARIPFATHDFQMIRDNRNDEKSEFRGVRTRFSSSIGT